SWPPITGSLRANQCRKREARIRPLFPFSQNVVNIFHLLEMDRRSSYYHYGAPGGRAIQFPEASYQFVRRAIRRTPSDPLCRLMLEATLNTLVCASVLNHSRSHYHRREQGRFHV